MTRQFTPRTIRVVGEAQRELLAALAPNLPILDPPLEVVIRPEKKKRTLSQNDLMWAGPLTDIERDGWIGGRQYSAETWHEYSKKHFMPETDHPELARLVKDNESYLKWDVDPDGERICVASTTQLTKYGFSWYLEQIYALGASLGVQFIDQRRAA